MTIITKWGNTMDSKQLEKGAQAKIASTGQIVEVKRVSNHGFSVVRFQTGVQH